MDRKRGTSPGGDAVRRGFPGNWRTPSTMSFCAVRDNVFARVPPSSVTERWLPCFRALGHTPNVITTYSFAFSLLSVVSLWHGHTALFAACFALAYVFDCADGQYARAYRMTSVNGDLYDHGRRRCARCAANAPERRHGPGRLRPAAGGDRRSPRRSPARLARGPVRVPVHHDGGALRVQGPAAQSSRRRRARVSAAVDHGARRRTPAPARDVGRRGPPVSPPQMDPVDASVRTRHLPGVHRPRRPSGGTGSRCASCTCPTCFPVGSKERRDEPYNGCGGVPPHPRGPTVRRGGAQRRHRRAPSTLVRTPVDAGARPHCTVGGRACSSPGRPSSRPVCNVTRGCKGKIHPACRRCF